MGSSGNLPYWRLSGFYFVYFATLGAWVPFWPIYLNSLDFNAQQIGYLAGVMMATKIVAPSLWGWWADRSHQRMRIIRFGALAAAIIFTVALWRTDFWSLFLVIVGYSFFWNAILSQFDVVTLTRLGTQYNRYSLLRVWGSIGFIVIVTLLGWLFDYGSVAVLPWVVFVLLVGIFISSLTITEKPADGVSRLPVGAFSESLRRPEVLVFFLCCFLLQFSHGPYYTFFSLFTQEHGYSRWHTGMLWNLGVLAEVFVFLFMHRLLLSFSLKTIAAVSFGLSALRWMLTAFYIDEPWILVFAQCLHAASFGSYHAYAVEMVRRLFDRRLHGRAMALYSGLSYGLGGAVGAVASGWLWDVSPQWTFLTAAIACFVALLLTLFTKAQWSR